MEGVTELFCFVALAEELSVVVVMDFVSAECAEILISDGKDCLVSFHGNYFLLIRREAFWVLAFLARFCAFLRTECVWLDPPFEDLGWMFWSWLYQFQLGFSCSDVVCSGASTGCCSVSVVGVSGSDAVCSVACCCFFFEDFFGLGAVSSCVNACSFNSISVSIVVLF